MLLKKIVVNFQVLFLQRAHGPDRPQLGSNWQSAIHRTRALANAPTGMPSVVVISRCDRQDELFSCIQCFRVFICSSSSSSSRKVRLQKSEDKRTALVA